MDATTDTPSDAELPRLLNITQVADHLGVNVRHVRRLVYERQIPFIKRGHLIRFDSADVQRWMKENVRTPGYAGPARRRVTTCDLLQWCCDGRTAETATAPASHGGHEGI